VSSLFHPRIWWLLREYTYLWQHQHIYNSTLYIKINIKNLSTKYITMKTSGSLMCSISFYKFENTIEDEQYGITLKSHGIT